MESKYKNKIITIPNILSLFRLLLIPVIMWLYIVKKDPYGRLPYWYCPVLRMLWMVSSPENAI